MRKTGLVLSVIFCFSAIASYAHVNSSDTTAIEVWSKGKRGKAVKSSSNATRKPSGLSRPEQHTADKPLNNYQDSTAGPKRASKRAYGK